MDSFFHFLEASACSLPQTDHGTSWREGEHSWYPMPDMSTKHNTYVVDQKLKRFDDVSFREDFGRIICFQTKICPFLRQGWPFFFMEQSWSNSFNLSCSFDRRLLVVF